MPYFFDRTHGRDLLILGALGAAAVAALLLARPQTARWHPAPGETVVVAVAAPPPTNAAGAALVREQLRARMADLGYAVLVQDAIVASPGATPGFTLRATIANMNDRARATGLPVEIQPGFVVEALVR